MADRLTVQGAWARRDEWVIQWICDGDDGGCLGEDVYTRADIATADEESWNHVVANVVAAEMLPQFGDAARRDGMCGYIFDREADARAVLRAIKTEWKSLKSSRPWPEWAKTAAANGWKAPKGWQP